MSVLLQLANAVGRRDEVPNEELAKLIVATEDKNGVKELVENLASKNKDIQNDCIKVLYEVGERKPELIAGHTDQFLALLNQRNNRLQWGAMAALSCIAKVNSQDIYRELAQIMEAADKGSVITRDNAVNILIELAGHPPYTKEAVPLLVAQLLSCPANQLPMYAEKALPIVNEKNEKVFLSALLSRLEDMEKESKRKRVEKVIHKIQK